MIEPLHPLKDFTGIKLVKALVLSGTIFRSLKESLMPYVFYFITVLWLGPWRISEFPCELGEEIKLSGYQREKASHNCSSHLLIQQ